MVNEINKPPSHENAVLGERLAASQRSMQQMQEEHRQLLQEMEILRQRATELSHRSANLQQEREEEERQAQANKNVSSTLTSIASAANTTTAATTDTTTGKTTNPITSDLSPSLPVTATTTPTDDSSQSSTVENAEVEGDPKDDEYIQQKIAEIAALKAQFKRVEHMISTTKLIEDHMASKANETNNDSSVSTSTNDCTNTEKSTQGTTSSTTATEVLPSSTNEDNTHDQNVQLLSNMLSVFTEFTGDLRSQADNLRAERERIRNLKEELIKRKRES